MHYSAIYNDMFQPYKWAIIRLLVEPMGRLYTRSSHRFYQQPDDGPFIRPNHVIVYCTVMHIT